MPKEEDEEKGRDLSCLHMRLITIDLVHQWQGANDALTHGWLYDIVFTDELALLAWIPRTMYATMINVQTV